MLDLNVRTWTLLCCGVLSWHCAAETKPKVGQAMAMDQAGFGDSDAAADTALAGADGSTSLATDGFSPPGGAAPTAAPGLQGPTAGGPLPATPADPSAIPGGPAEMTEPVDGPGPTTGAAVPPPPYTLPGFENLAPPMGAPLDMAGSPLTPPPPQGWVWYEIEGATCRDGSGTGFYVRYGTADKLLIYLEGGGACSNAGFCGFNPASGGQILSGDGETVLGSAAGATGGRQQPGAYTGTQAGAFDITNDENPFRDWHQIYIPYCTGDVHFGTRTGVDVPGIGPQNFVGYLNMQKFMGRIVPTFKDKVNQAVITGASAGGFGASMNYSMVQDAFGDDAHVLLVDDSGPPFSDAHMPVCMQKRWREQWGFDASLPADCETCRSPDGGGLGSLFRYVRAKHPHARMALISSMEDEVIRLFYSVGLVNCANYDSADPVGITLAQFDPNTYFPAANYRAGLDALRADYADEPGFSTYYIGGANLTLHQHIFRPRFYQQAAGGVSVANYLRDFIAGTATHVGP